MFTIPALIPSWPYESRVMITTESPNSVNVTLSTSYLAKITRTINRNNGADIELPYDMRVYLGDGKQNKTIIVRASDVVSVYAITNNRSAGDAFQSIQTAQLGKKYYVASYRPYSTHVSSFVCVSAVNSDTSVSISTQSGLEHVFLQQYESYRYDGRDYEDLSGTLVQSNKPIAVISGSTSSIADGGSSDGILSQLKPTESWGTVYYIFPFKELTSGFVYRVFASDMLTTLDMSDDSVILIQSGDFYEGDVSGNSIVSFQADQKVMVVQYMKSYLADNAERGDPSMVVVQPVSLHTNNVTFPVFNYTYFNGHTYYINVVTECKNVDGLVFDDSTQAASWDKLTTNDQTMCCVWSNVTSGYHSITHANQTARFSVSVYAICNGYCSSSYAYAATGIPAQGRYFEFILHHYSCQLLNCE